MSGEWEKPADHSPPRDKSSVPGPLACPLPARRSLIDKLNAGWHKPALLIYHMVPSRGEEAHIGCSCAWNTKKAKAAA